MYCTSLDGSNICFRRTNRIIVKKIILNQTQKDLLQEHATKYGSNESCAMLLGIHNGEEWNVKEIFLTRNSSENSEVTFGIAPEELLQGYKLADEKNLELVAIFHSHPNSNALPSNTDKKFMKLNGDIPWIIFSGINIDFKAYVLDEEIEEIPIKIMERHFFQ